MCYYSGTTPTILVWCQLSADPYFTLSWLHSDDIFTVPNTAASLIIMCSLPAYCVYLSNNKIYY